MPRHIRVGINVVIAAFMTLVSCGRQSGEYNSEQANSPSLKIEFPDAIASRAVSSGSTLAHEGADWDDYFTIKRMDTQIRNHGFGYSTSGVFQPVGTDAAQVAASVYGFEIGTFEQVTLCVAMEWTSAPWSQPTDAYIGLSKPSGDTGYFEWHQLGDSDHLQYFPLPDNTDWGDYTLMNGKIYVAIVLTCDENLITKPIYILDWIRLGIYNLAPTASLLTENEPPFGYVEPADVWFSTDGSSDDDGFIYQVGIDWDGPDEYGRFSFTTYYSSGIYLLDLPEGDYTIYYYMADNDNGCDPPGWPFYDTTFYPPLELNV